MPYGIILHYSTTSAVAAALAAVVSLILRLTFIRRPLERRDAWLIVFIAYLAAVVQIIGLRVGLVEPKLLDGAVRWMPMVTTIEQWRKGAGLFIYHTVGNLGWFVPLGLLLPRLFPCCRWWHVVLCGALLSVSVEALQYRLGTGLADIDDILLNTLGAWLGYILFMVLSKMRLRNMNRPCE